MLLVLVPTTVYVLAIQLVGIYVASALFIAAFMRVMDKYSWLKTAAGQRRRQRDAVLDV